VGARAAIGRTIGAWHLLQRWGITYRLRYARGDLFLGPYRHGRSAAIALEDVLARISERLGERREAEPQRMTGSGASVRALRLF
jgi:hypothetical protein